MRINGLPIATTGAVFVMVAGAFVLRVEQKLYLVIIERNDTMNTNDDLNEDDFEDERAREIIKALKEDGEVPLIRGPKTQEIKVEEEE